MIELLGTDGLASLQNFITPATLFAFDLDGTLAPIVDDPSAVKIPATIRKELEQLSARAVTAIITGRSQSDALPRLGFKPHYLVGNHGAEGLPGSQGEQQQLRTVVKDWEQQLAVLLPPQIRSATLLERKEYSLSLHYRHAPDPVATHTALLSAISRLDPAPRRIGGKCVENLIPRGTPHKGDALVRLINHAGCPSAFFLGDDETDEDVFRLEDPRIFSACVGTERATAARYYLKNIAETERLLQLVTTLLTTRQQAAQQQGRHT